MFCTFLLGVANGLITFIFDWSHFSSALFPRDMSYWMQNDLYDMYKIT